DSLGALSTVGGSVTTGLSVTESILQGGDDFAHYMLKRSMRRAMEESFEVLLWQQKGGQYSNWEMITKKNLFGYEFATRKDVDVMHQVMKHEMPGLCQTFANTALDVKKDPARLDQLAHKTKAALDKV